MKSYLISILILVLTGLGLIFSGCSSKYDGPYHRDTPTSPSGKKSPATQRPYTIKGQRYVPLASAHGYAEKGLASWYGRKFHGRKTSNGETYNMYAMTAAHKTLPMNTWVRVENLDNGRAIKLRINDRGPFVRSRIIDLSYAGAKKLGVIGPGTARVRVTALGRATSYAKADKSKPVAFKPVDYWKGNFTVQVGAFKVRGNAEKYRLKLSKTYINAHIVPYKDHRGRFYRVRIGQFRRLEDAVTFSRQLLKDGFDAAFAVGE
jgi:rare lipoprotein A